MSNKLKKIVASVMTVASLVVCTAGMSVSAANGKLTVYHVYKIIKYYNMKKAKIFCLPIGNYFFLADFFSITGSFGWW